MSSRQSRAKQLSVASAPNKVMEYDIIYDIIVGTTRLVIYEDRRAGGPEPLEPTSGAAPPPCLSSMRSSRDRRPSCPSIPPPQVRSAPPSWSRRRVTSVSLSNTHTHAQHTARGPPRRVASRSRLAATPDGH